jgi:hypothetical protein
MKLTKAQGQRLLKLHLTGEMGGGAWSTMKALGDKGMVNLGQKITVTPKGINWCNANHLNY